MIEDNNQGKKFDNGKPNLELLAPVYWNEVGSILSYQVAKWYFYDECFLPDVYSLKYDPTSILTYGASKYSRHNWHKGMRWGRLVGAFHRHCNKFDTSTNLWIPRDLNELDEETNEPHGKHAACCLLFLKEYDVQYTMGHLIGENDCAWNENKATLKQFNTNNSLINSAELDLEDKCYCTTDTFFTYVNDLKK